MITLPELFVWLHDKARNKSTWDIIEMNHSICAVAYQVAGKPDVSKSELANAALNLHSFRDFLVQLYVLCILWVHFKSADSVGETEHVNDQCLDLPKFIVACRTFSRAQAHEPLTEAKLVEDFNLLDTNHNGSVEFSEVISLLNVRHASVLLFATLIVSLILTQSHNICCRCAPTVHNFSIPTSPTSSTPRIPRR